MQQALCGEEGCEIPGRLFLKMDSHLAIAGSVKARGGIYEVLKHAEELALAAGKLTVTDNYEKLAAPEMKEFFGKYTVQVGSTAAITSGVWPLAGMTQLFSLISSVAASSLKYLPQAEQVQYALLPSSVQVASFTGVPTTVWPLGETSLVSVLPQRSQVLVSTPGSVQVGSVVTTHSP